MKHLRPNNGWEVRKDNLARYEIICDIPLTNGDAIALRRIRTILNSSDQSVRVDLENGEKVTLSLMPDTDVAIVRPL